MAISDFYKDLDFTHLFDVSKADSIIDMDEFRQLAIDKVYFSGDFPAIFFKEVKQFDNDTLKIIAEIQHLIWNYRKVMFLFVTSLTEVRIYNCNKKPFNYTNNEINLSEKLKEYVLLNEDIHALRKIREIFSRTAVDSGTLWNTENDLREKINIENRVDRFLVKSLLEAAKELKKDKLTDEIIHSLLMRSIFIMYLEDKGAAKETTLYSDINKTAACYFDILESKKNTYELFKKVEAHFNGNIFPLINNEEEYVTNHHLAIIKKCLFDGDLSNTPKLFQGWRLFRFDIIQIELLSEIYENFLEEFRAHKKEEAGQYYTPPALVELILNEKLTAAKSEKNWNVKILDPACGSGIFLVESFKRLVKRWKNGNPNKSIDFTDLKKILEENIFGIEYDRLAIRVATFSLYLAIVEQLNPSTLWIDNSRKFPYLIKDEEDGSLKKQGKNLFRADTIKDIKPEHFTQVNLVVGNPPFGSKTDKHTPTKEFCINHGFGQDLVIPFLTKAIDFAKDGSIALIFNTKVLTNTERPFENFRQWLFNKTYVEKIYNLSIFRKANKSFGGQLFTSAVGPVSIAFYQGKAPVKISPTIEYWAPKTYVKNSLVEGVVIDATDIKFLPREECQKLNTKIWKIAMWGTLEDYSFIETLKNKNYSLGHALKKYNLIDGIGLHKKESADNFTLVNGNLIPTKGFSRFFVHKDKCIKVKKEFRNIDLNLFKTPFLTIKESIKKDQRVCATYFPFDSFYLEAIYGIYSMDQNENYIKALTAVLNSDFSTYFMFLTTSTWGIERDRIKKNEVLSLLINDKVFTEYLYTLSNLTLQAYSYLSENYPMNVSVSEIEKRINNVVNEIFNLKEHEVILINDTLKYSIDLFYNGHKSIALHPTIYEENIRYAILLSKELEEFLQTKDNIQVNIFDIQKNQPLNMVKIIIGGNKISSTAFSAQELNQHLLSIDRYLLKKESKNIYIKKQLKYFEDNTIYIIKPNQKRFWTGSAALNDAKELISEILNMNLV